MADPSQIESAKQVVSGAAPAAIILGALLAFLRWGRRLVRTAIAEWAGEQEKRQREIDLRDREQDQARDEENRRLRGELEAERRSRREEVEAERTEREKNADLMRGWYFRYVELHLRHGGRMDDVPPIEGIARVGPDRAA